MVRSPSDLLLTMEPGFRRKTAPVEVWEDEIQNLQLGEGVELNSGDEIRRLMRMPSIAASASAGDVRFCRRRLRAASAPNTPCVRRITNQLLLRGGIFLTGAVSAATEPGFILARTMDAEGSPPHSVDRTRSAEISHSVAR
jgi:hypothetical protein